MDLSLLATFGDGSRTILKGGSFDPGEGGDTSPKFSNFKKARKIGPKGPWRSLHNPLMQVK